MYKEMFFILAFKRSLLLLLVMGGLVMNTFIPAGAMLKTDMNGKTQITVCTQQGLMTAWLDPLTGKLQKNTDEDSENMPHCPFAAPSSIIANMNNSSIHFVIAIAMPYRASLPPTKRFIGQTPLRLSARGPPVFS